MIRIATCIAFVLIGLICALPAKAGHCYIDNSGQFPIEICNPAETYILQQPGFVPDVLQTELRRGVILGNPPGQGLLLPSKELTRFDRPQQIPQEYPLGLNDGVRFTQP
jgi:hypothetical protein